MTYYTRLTDIVNSLHDSPSDNCLEWFGTFAGRYGQIQVSGKKIPVHRLAWAIYHDKPFPQELVAHHKCQNKRCYNPLHILPVTTYQNLAMPDGIVGISKSKTHCPQGHEYTEYNTRVYRGMRTCRTCDRLRNRERLGISQRYPE